MTSKLWWVGIVGQPQPWVVFVGQRKVLWHNMREEPVLYINGKPYVVREANKPFANLEYTGPPPPR